METLLSSCGGEVTSRVLDRASESNGTYGWNYSSAENSRDLHSFLILQGILRNFPTAVQRIDKTRKLEQIKTD